MKLVFLFVLISSIALFSCKKDKKDKDNDCAISEANLAGSYKIVSIKYKASASAQEVDYIDQLLEPCEKDDVVTLNADHTYTSTDAGTACSPNGTYTGDWSLSNNIISVDGDPATLESFSCSGFSAISTDFATTGDKLTFTYTKQ